MNKYLLIDNSTMSRESFAALIYELENEAIVHECKSLEHTQQELATHHSTDFIVCNSIDNHAHDSDLFEKLKQIAPKCKCLFITHSASHTNIEALPDHIVAVITVSSPKSEIIAALRSMKIGQRYIGREVKKVDLINGSAHQPDRLPTLKYRFANEIKDRLTPRQCEVLDYMVKGCANKLIAYELGVSEGTVKLHVSSILKALKVTNRTEAAMRAGQFINSHAH